MTPLVLAAVFAGLVGSPHCAAMCGGLVTAVGRHPWPWHLGRIGTYSLLGAAAGGTGAAFPGPGWLVSAVSVVLLLYFSASLAGLVTVREPQLPQWLGFSGGTLSRFAFGGLSGLLPCGLIYATLSLCVSAGGAGQGAMVAVAFGASTLPALSTLVIGVRTVVDRSVWTRRAIALAVLVCGLTSVGLRWSPLSDEAAPCHIQPEFAL